MLDMKCLAFWLTYGRTAVFNLCALKGGTLSCMVGM